MLLFVMYTFAEIQKKTLDASTIYKKNNNL